MKHILLSFLLVLGLAGTAGARCTGVDYRSQLNGDQQARLQREAQKTPFAYGNHWIATKDARRIHVIGTMHVGDRRLGQVVRRLRPVLDQADAVLFEISDFDLDKLDRKQYEAIFRRHFVLPKNRSLKQLASPEVWTLLTRLAAANGMDLEILDRLQPWAASHLLIGDSCRPTGFGTRRGLDERLERYAVRKRIPVGSLETGDEAWGAFSGESLSNQMRSLELDLALQLSEAPVNVSGAETYFDQAIWEGFILFRWEMYQHVKAPKREIDRHWERLIENLLSKRNRNWLPRILATEGDVLVVAVGAAHLPGRAGVLNLLKSRGYKLERAPW